MIDVQLRPLTIGEIFDRAVTLYVRNAVPFAIVAAFVAVPSAFVQYFLAASNGSTLQQVIAQAQHPGKAQPGPDVSLWIIPAALLMIAAQPFMYVAMASLVGRIYRGQNADWRDSYKVALRHTGGIIMMLICAGGIFMVALGVLMFAVFLVVMIAAGLGALFLPLGVVGAVLAAGAFLAMAATLMLIYLSIALAFNAIGIEELDFGRALGSGFSRIWYRAAIGKALLVALAIAAVQLGVAVLTMAIQGFAEVALRSPILDAALSSLLVLFSTGFYGVLVAVYYFDVRVRREGLDVEAAIDSLQAQTQP